MIKQEKNMYLRKNIYKSEDDRKILRYSTMYTHLCKLNNYALYVVKIYVYIPL